MSAESSNPSDDRWATIPIDLDALHKIVCEVFRVSPSQCGPPIPIGLHGRYSRVFTFQLPTLKKVVARLVYPIKPLFKTEGEVAAMDLVRSHTSLPVPTVFAYCSEATNPVGTEWLIMEHMPGIELDEAWNTFGLPQKRRLALDLVDLFDQLYRIRADGCGSIYHKVDSVDDSSLRTKVRRGPFEAKSQRTPRWVPLSLESLELLKAHCKHSIYNDYSLGPLNDIALLEFNQPIPSASQTMPVFSSDEYVKLVAFNGNPTTRSYFSLPTHEKCVELFQSIYALYPHSSIFGPSESSFHFTHGDLHDANILVDPQTGEITGILDWELAAFRPLWTEACAVGWFEEDGERFMSADFDAGNFEDDTPKDAELRAFFRSELNKRNPDLFWSFLGAIELRAVLDAATDVPPPVGSSDIFLWRYNRLGCWNEDRRGPFPWDMLAWTHRRLDLDEIQNRERKKAISSSASSQSNTGPSTVQSSSA